MKLSFIASLVAASFATVTAAAQGLGFAYEAAEAQTRLLADRQVERAGLLMNGVGALLPRNEMSGRAGALNIVGTSAWAAMGGNHLASSRPGGEYHGDQFNGIAGMDMTLDEWLVVGLSVGGEARQLDTGFNLGKLTSAGVTVSPYLIARLDTNVFVDASFSYTRSYSDLERNDFFFAPTVFGHYNTNRYVGNANVHGVWNVDNWRLGVHVGYLHVRQDDQSYTMTGGCFFDCDVPDKSTDLGQVRGGVRVGYAFGDFVPYVVGRVDYNVIRPVGFDGSVTQRLGGFAGAGLRWNIARNIAGTVQGNTIVGREHETNYGGYATLRFSW